MLEVNKWTNVKQRLGTTFYALIFRYLHITIYIVNVLTYLIAVRQDFSILRYFGLCFSKLHRARVILFLVIEVDKFTNIKRR